MSFQLYYRYLTNKTIVVNIDPDQTIRDLAEIIGKKENAHPETLNLSCGSSQIQDYTFDTRTIRSLDGFKQNHVNIHVSVSWGKWSKIYCLSHFYVIFNDKVFTIAHQVKNDTIAKMKKNIFNHCSHEGCNDDPKGIHGLKHELLKFLDADCKENDGNFTLILNNEELSDDATLTESGITENTFVYAKIK
jgi:hypothetical protein